VNTGTRDTPWQPQNSPKSPFTGQDSRVALLSGQVLTVHHRLDGSRAQNILWLLEELEVPYELEIYHRNSLNLAPPELAKIHPLGKAPVLTITPPGGSEPVVLAEGPFIAAYLAEHWGKDKQLMPKRWKDGQEGKILGETEEWMRYQYLLYFVEGTFFPYLLLYLVFNGEFDHSGSHPLPPQTAVGMARLTAPQS
jgi:glutathione S-transferase